MSSTVDQGRGLLYFLGPLTGARATGSVVVKPAAGAGDQTLQPNTWLCPVVNGAIRPQVLYRVLPDYTKPPADSGSWLVPQAGLSVPVEAHVGGTAYNLLAGTVMRFADDAIPDGFAVDSCVVGTGGLGGADNDPYYGSDLVRGVAMYEALGTPQMQLELFRAQLGKCPSVLLVWTGSGAPKWAGRGAARYPEMWELMVIVDRADNDPARRGEGLRLLDRMEDLVLWRTIAGDEAATGKGGIIVSADASVTPRTRRRVTGTSPFFQQAYVYSIGIQAIRVATRVDFRQFEPWRKTRLDVNFPVTNPPGDPNVLPIVRDNEFPMIQDDEG